MANSHAYFRWEWITGFKYVTSNLGHFPHVLVLIYFLNIFSSLLWMWPIELQLNKKLVFQDLKYRETLCPSFPFNASSFTQTKIYIKSNQSSKQTSNHSSDWLSVNHVISLKHIKMSKWRKYLNWKVGLCVFQWLFYNKLPQTYMWKVIIHFAYGFCKSIIQTKYGKKDLSASLGVR